MTPREEAKIWSCYFDGGSFLLASSEEELGYSWGADMHDAARDAWWRLGRLYLDESIGRVEGLEVCGTGRWALETFGEPERCQ